jgi:hypothetical protein
VTAFFVGLGLEVEGKRMFVEGEFLDRHRHPRLPDRDRRYCAHPTEVPGWSCRASSANHEPGSPARKPSELGLRNAPSRV